MSTDAIVTAAAAQREQPVPPGKLVAWGVLCVEGPAAWMTSSALDVVLTAVPGR